MTGPKRRGFWMADLPASVHADIGGLRPGQRYTVIQAFRDYDGDDHPVGETWIFLGHNFLPYDDGLSLFVSKSGDDEWHIRMQWRPEEQGPIIDAFDRYVRRD
jgi:Domain of unknown function (DUF3601)